MHQSIRSLRAAEVIQAHGPARWAQPTSTGDGPRPERPLADQPLPPRRLNLAALVCLIFFTVSGGAFGLEPLVGAVGPGWAVVLVLLIPVLWGLPIALMVAELIDPPLPGYRQPEIGSANGRRVVSAYIRNETHLETIQSAANVAQVFLHGDELTE